MKKNYNYYVTSQKTPQFKLKRLLHILSSTSLIVNLIAFAILLPDIRLWTFGLAFVFTAYLFVQLFDRRKDQWAWWVIIFGIFISIVVSAERIFQLNSKTYSLLCNELILPTFKYCTWRNNFS